MPLPRSYEIVAMQRLGISAHLKFPMRFPRPPKTQKMVQKSSKNDPFSDPQK